MSLYFTMVLEMDRENHGSKNNYVLLKRVYREDIETSRAM
jgi:hypothetical protein